MLSFVQAFLEFFSRITFISICVHPVRYRRVKIRPAKIDRIVMPDPFY